MDRFIVQSTDARGKRPVSMEAAIPAQECETNAKGRAMAHVGSCFCGAVEVQVTGTPEGFLTPLEAQPATSAAVVSAKVSLMMVDFIIVWFYCKNSLTTKYTKHAKGETRKII